MTRLRHLRVFGWKRTESLCCDSSLPAVPLDRRLWTDKHIHRNFTRDYILPSQLDPENRFNLSTIVRTFRRNRENLPVQLPGLQG